jgi:hypothetical protein
VKGGRIAITEGTRNWTSTDRNGITFNIKDPVMQAMKGKHHIVKRLKERPEWSPAFINARHGVILPDNKRAPHNLGANMPLRIFAFADDMPRLEDWVTRRFGDVDDGDDESRIRPLGRDGIRALKALLSDGITFNIDLRTYLDDDVGAIERLTEQQYWILVAMASNRRMAIPGAAGTGKTLLAAKKAVLMTEAGQNVLLVCYNAPLAAFLKLKLGRIPLLTVGNYHQLALSAAERAGLQIPPANQIRNPDLSGLFLKALDALPDHRYDAIVVDEGQDFEADWLESLECALADADDGTYHIFYDSNQDVQNRSGGYIESTMQSEFDLTRNFRNTRNIFRLSKRFYSGPPVMPIGPKGVDVEWITVQRPDDPRAVLRSWLGRLLKEDAISPERIAVLCRSRAAVEELAPDNRLGRVEVTDAARREPGKPVVDSIRRFKGLESDVVAIFQPEEFLDDIELLYVATSRARVKLSVIGEEQALGFLRETC